MQQTEGMSPGLDPDLQTKSKGHFLRSIGEIWIWIWKNYWSGKVEITDLKKSVYEIVCAAYDFSLKKLQM